MSFNRRGFFGLLGSAAVAAPAVKQMVTLPDEPKALERFAGGIPAKQPAFDLAAMPMWDVQDGILYDRMRFPPGATLPAVLNFFSFCVGQTCGYTNAQKTFRHTNMYSPGQLNAPNEFLARKIIFAVHPSASVADVALISQEAYWEFQLMQKIMARGPMLLNGPAPAGLRDIVGIDGKPKDPLPDEVLATARNCDTMGGTLIPCLTYFSVRVHTPERVTLQIAKEGGRGLDLLIGFVGLDARAVQ